MDSTNQYATTTWRDGGFRVMPLNAGNVELSVVSGQTKPTYLGWIPAGTQKKKPSQVAVFNWKAKGPTTKVWILTPKTDDDEWHVQNFQLLEASDAGAIKARLFTAAGEGLFRRLPSAENSAKGDVAYIQLDPSGKQMQHFEIECKLDE